MDLQLKNKVIFVAGGSRGIGLGIVEACLAEGAKLALTARGAEALAVEHARLAKTWGVDRLWSFAADMRDPAAIETAIARTEAEFGAIWGAVANVGLTHARPASRSMTRPGTPASTRTSTARSASPVRRCAG